MRLVASTALYVLSLLLVVSSASAAFCKCICFDRYEIVPLYRPADPEKPCLTCTKQFCLDQKLEICKDASLGELDPDVGTGEEGDVQTRCFERDSLMAKTVIISFLLVTTALIVGAGVKQRYPQLFDRFFPSSSRPVHSKLRGGNPYSDPSLGGGWFSLLQR